MNRPIVPFPGSRSSKTEFVADASDLRWAPGLVAASIDFDGEVFDYSRSTASGDETVSWHYVSPTGRTITVFND